MSGSSEEPGARSSSVAIVGLGLIGGSVARRLLEAGWTVRWNDPAVEPARVEAVPRLSPIEQSELTQADLVVLATPTGIAIDLLRELDLGDAVVTSVCSVMAPLAEVAASRSIHFVAGHPMAGREVKGWEHSESELFEGRPWFRSNQAEAEAVDLVDRLIEACGAAVVPIAPVDHDRYAAVASHLPQLLSSALAAMIEQEGVPEPFHGPGLRTFLRLAGSPWSTWEPVFDLNAEPLLRAREALEEMIRRIDEGHGREVFDSANRLYRRLTESEGPATTKKG